MPLHTPFDSSCVLYIYIYCGLFADASNFVASACTRCLICLSLFSMILRRLPIGAPLWLSARYFTSQKSWKTLPANCRFISLWATKARQRSVERAKPSLWNSPWAVPRLPNNGPISQRQRLRANWIERGSIFQSSSVAECIIHLDGALASTNNIPSGMEDSPAALCARAFRCGHGPAPKTVGVRLIHWGCCVRLVLGKLGGAVGRLSLSETAHWTIDRCRIRFGKSTGERGLVITPKVSKATFRFARHVASPFYL